MKLSPKQPLAGVLEPVFAILFAATFVYETIGPIQIIGMILVLAASVMVQLPERNRAAAVLSHSAMAD